MLGVATGTVIALDIGAEFATTWHKLAGRFADAIDMGELVLGVTNLTPSLKGHRTILLDYQEHALRVAQKAADGRVQFITSNGRSLPDQTIPLLNGSSLRLEGNVSLVHEFRSVSYWSQIPGTDILGLARTLAPDGTYMVPTDNCAYPYPYIPGLSVDERIVRQDQRAREITHAHTVLRGLGLQHTQSVEAGQYQGHDTTYHIFKGPRALSIDV